MNVGKIKQVIGPTIDVEFEPGKLPSILNAVTVKRVAGSLLTGEVAQHLADHILVTGLFEVRANDILGIAFSFSIGETHQPRGTKRGAV